MIHGHRQRGRESFNFAGTMPVFTLAVASLSFTGGPKGKTCNQVINLRYHQKCF
jgi:hypothetical protein